MLNKKFSSNTSLTMLIFGSVLTLAGPTIASARDRNEVQQTSQYGYSNNDARSDRNTGVDRSTRVDYNTRAGYNAREAYDTREAYNAREAYNTREAYNNREADRWNSYVTHKRWTPVRRRIDYDADDQYIGRDDDSNHSRGYTTNRYTATPEHATSSNSSGKLRR